MMPDGRIEVPRPTAWPMIAAFGITLTCAGLVTNVTVSVVGVVAMLAGAIGWFRDVLPVEDREAGAVVPEGPAAFARRAETHLEIGEAGHRPPTSREIYPDPAVV